MSHVKSARELQAKSIISALEKRNMTAVYCESAEDFGNYPRRQCYQLGRKHEHTRVRHSSASQRQR